MGMANPQEENMHLNNPLRSRKRAAIVITASANDTPQKATDNSTAKQTSTTENTVTMEMLDKKLTDFWKEIEDIQNKKLQEMKTQLEEQLAEKIKSIMDAT
eukprot:11618211-Ditylum_brightwellii.AAC.1